VRPPLGYLPENGLNSHQLVAIASESLSPFITVKETYESHYRGKLLKTELAYVLFAFRFVSFRYGKCNKNKTKCVPSHTASYNDHLASDFAIILGEKHSLEEKIRIGIRICL
jgi:hypothetical protein